MTKLSNIKIALWVFYAVILSLSRLGYAQTYLFNRADFPIGTYPTGIAVADFNRDGNLDLVLGDIQEGSVSILLGKNDGTFAKRIIYTGFNPGAVASGDFNRDGKPDVAVTNWSSNTVSILLGNGNGTFQLAMNFSTSLQPSQIVVADFNRDGKLDVAVSHNAGTSVSVLLGNGDGTLRGYVDYVVPSGSIGIVAADFNRDGKLDLAAADTWANAVCVLLGNGDGTFQPSTSVPAGEVPVALAVGDVNGDGFLDVVVSDGPDCGCGFVSVVLGNGNGTFRSPLTINLPGPGGNIVLGDFNGDHKLDFGVTSSTAYSGVVYVFLGNGNGTFRAGGQFGPDGSAAVFATGDFNHDRILDLAVAAFNGNNASSASVLLGNGDGTFGRFSAYGTAQQSASIVSADLNGDGRVDLAALDPFFQTVAVLLNTGQGTFKKSVLYQVGNTGQQGEIIARDFNGDGKADLVVTDFQDGTVSILLNLGSGIFASHVDYSAVSYPVTLVAGDFNGDGKLDLVVGGFSGLSFLAGNGVGGFRLQSSFVPG